MDPFNEVQEDANSTIGVLEDIVAQSGPINQDTKLDFENNFQEIQEILKDLQLALEASEADPKAFQLNDADISSRRQQLSLLNQRVRDIRGNWSSRLKTTNREVTSMSNRISQDSQRENPFDDENTYETMDQFQQQEMIKEQDVHLDSIHETMRNLNQQAQLIGGELEDQTGMLDDLDRDLDNVGDRVQRGLKRIGHVIEKNRERASDWCIALLVVALVVLLILVIAI